MAPCDPPPSGATPKRPALKRHSSLTPPSHRREAVPTPLELQAVVIDEESAHLTPPSSTGRSSLSSDDSTQPLKSKRASWSGELEVVHTVYDTHYRRTCWKRHRRLCASAFIYLVLAATIVALLYAVIRQSQTSQLESG